MADYFVWRKVDGTQAGYDQWRANFGAAAGSGPLSVVPEPATLVLLILTTVGGCLRQVRTA
jgi:hypothetical protein